VFFIGVFEDDRNKITAEKKSENKFFRKKIDVF